MTNYLVLTGGSRGIGKATIKHFLEQNWTAINLSRTSCQISNVIDISIDFSDPKNIAQAAHKLPSLLQNADNICLVNNVGYFVGDSVENIGLDDLNKTLNINLISSIELNKILIPLMKPGSSIIYLGSMLANKGVPNTASYIISKHAVLGLMRSTCQDLAPKKISTCCICPGLVDTELLHNSMDEHMIKYVLDNFIVGKRLIQPHEIAKVIYACATSPVTNGALIPVNLGLVAD